MKALKTIFGAVPINVDIPPIVAAYAIPNNNAVSKLDLSLSVRPGIVSDITPHTAKPIGNNINVVENPIAAKQELGLFPDPFGIYERLTPREYIQYFAELSGMSTAFAIEATTKVIAELKLADIADRRCKGFSQGQRMKTALAQAIVHRPKNIILDEPTRGLDVMSTRVLRDMLRKLKSQGHCILFSSHVMQEVASLCDQVIVMADGKAVAIGSPEELCVLTNKESLEEAFLKLIGTDEGIAA